MIIFSFIILGVTIIGLIIALATKSDSGLYVCGRVVNKEFIKTHWSGETQIPDRWYFIVVGDNKVRKIQVSKDAFDKFNLESLVLINF